MELQRGNCFMCTDANKVLDSKEAQQFLKIIPKLIGNELLNESEFQKLRRSVKVCPTCAHKLLAVNKIRKKFDEKSPKDNKDRCLLCCTADDLVKVETDWKRFQEKAEGICCLNNCKFVYVCVGCFFYIDNVSNIKKKLFHKYPQIRSEVKKPPPKVPKPVSNNSTPAQNGTPKRKGSPSPPSNSKKRKIFDNCFTYLQTLSTNVYHVDRSLRGDERLYRKIAYVKLFGEDLLKVNKTLLAHPHPKIKIKLKSPKQQKKPPTPSAKIKDEHSVAKVRKRLSLPESSTSANKPTKNTAKKTRRLSTPAESKTGNAEETPKSIIKTPRRRSSLFTAPTIEEDAENGDEEEVEDVGAKAVGNINDIVSAYIDDENAAKEAADEVINEISNESATPQDEESVEPAPNVEDKNEEEVMDEEEEMDRLTNDDDDDDCFFDKKEATNEDTNSGSTGSNNEIATPSFTDSTVDLSTANDSEEVSKKDDEKVETHTESLSSVENGTVLSRDDQNEDKSVEKITLDELYGDLKLDNVNDNLDVNESESLSDVERKKKRVTFCDDIL